MKIGFIGLGNMAMAMIGGVLAKGLARPEEIMGSARTAATREAVKQAYGIATVPENKQVAI